MEQCFKIKKGVDITNEALKIKPEKACRILHMEGLAEDTTRGHVGIRDEENRLYIKR